MPSCLPPPLAPIHELVRSLTQCRSRGVAFQEACVAANARDRAEALAPAPGEQILPEEEFREVRAGSPILSIALSFSLDEHALCNAINVMLLSSILLVREVRGTV